MAETLALAQALIARPSVTPEDAGCQELVAARLAPLGFACESLPRGGVSNLWARKGREGPLLCFLGHTDVVPPGPEEAWTSPPFRPTLRQGRLYGRGAADMKGSVAAWVTALERFLARHGGRHRGSLAVLLTSDEEGPAVHGTAHVVEVLQARGERVRWCLVGEPTAEGRSGDVVKHGRRGSLTGRLRVRGRQGHVAYPQHADNPVHRLAPALAALVARRWDEGDEHFPPTTLQVVELHAGVGAENVIPGELEMVFNLRYGPAWEAEALQGAVEALLAEHGLGPARRELAWRVGARPFLTPAGELVEAVREAVRRVSGLEPRLSTSGGTSDGRFLAPTGAQVVELGPPNASIHRVDEHVALADLEALTLQYEAVLEALAAP
ncbi:MAG: succinyl-diaminopimelate desuccinylase [Gammaproteobacteria bacterium]|nr:MAG: succinyl-diaminopimelate desuccinylase [Gammaproteobacteria bacterium]